MVGHSALISRTIFRSRVGFLDGIDGLVECDSLLDARRLAALHRLKLMWQKSVDAELHTRIDAASRMRKSVKTAILLLDSLPLWKRLNVTAFLATGIGDASPDAMGETYQDSIGRKYTRLFEQPIVIFEASQNVLREALSAGHEKGLTCSAYISSMFEQSNGDAGRKVFREGRADCLDLVGIALRGARKDVDRAAKGAMLHS